MLERIRGWGPSHKSFVTLALLLTFLLQLAVLAGEYLGSVWPLWHGQPVLLKTLPIDPRSLFRGNYVRLNYEISRVEQRVSSERFRSNEVVYVLLRQQGRYHVAAGLSHQPPGQGPFIRGRIQPAGDSYRIRYGIEAYFMPEQKALAMERAVRDQEVWAEVWLSDSGRAAIAGLFCQPGCD